MKFKTVVIIIILIFIISLVIAGILVNRNPYNEKWIIGKTYEQVVEKYGEFDEYITGKNYNGEPCCTIGSYILKPRKVGYLGTTSASYFSIQFDLDGIAYKCYERLERGW